jgi:ankyrin repeat protein
MAEIRHGTPGTALKLIGEGADIDAQNEEGNTALHIACIWHRKEIVKLLLEKGADIEIKNYNGHTALSTACFLRYKEIITLLEKHAANK